MVWSEAMPINPGKPSARVSLRSTHPTQSMTAISAKRIYRVSMCSFGQRAGQFFAAMRSR